MKENKPNITKHHILSYRGKKNQKLKQTLTKLISTIKNYSGDNTDDSFWTVSHVHTSFFNL